jgi:uncharacterized GH25 family protein
MMQGHEIWLENSKKDDANVELALVYGHNMRQDGIADIKRLKAFNYNPDGSKSDMDLIPGDKHYILRFAADKS